MALSKKAGRSFRMPKLQLAPGNFAVGFAPTDLISLVYSRNASLGAIEKLHPHRVCDCLLA
jgi:hypothetical protein